MAQQANLASKQASIFPYIEPFQSSPVFILVACLLFKRLRVDHSPQSKTEELPGQILPLFSYLPTIGSTVHC